MKAIAGRAAKGLALAVLLLLVAGIVAPYLSGDAFASRIQSALERSLGRKVDMGKVHFSIFNGPGFAIDDVVIHENPAFGVEPIAYVGTLEAVPRLGSLFTGRLDLASVRLDDASINVAKTGGAAEPGRWNFELLLRGPLMRAIPELHVRSGRINFKFGEIKSVFYLTGTDLDVVPPSGAAGWTVRFSGEPARTDKPAHGFGLIEAQGGWNQAGIHLDVRLEQSQLGEMMALFEGQDAGVHGTVSARMHLTGPPANIRLGGSMLIEDVHRWDLLPSHGQGWPFRLEGRLSLPEQTIEIESRSAGRETLPLSLRFRCADYLSQPHWGLALNWNRFPIGPLLELARHMGAALPPKLRMTGTLDGVLGYSGKGSLQGSLDFHDASLSMPDTPPLRSAEAQVIFDGGHARLMPVTVRTARDEQAQLVADYDWSAQSLGLTVATDSMRVESLRAQAALATIPWLEQVSSGMWSGQLHYQLTAAPPGAPPESGWTGQMELHDARFPVPGLAEPVLVASATAHLDGPRIRLDAMRAQAGAIAFTGDYRYEPQLARPHRLRLSVPEADAAELERLFMPSLRHSRSLLARALGLGRTALPDWLAGTHVDASLAIASLHLGMTGATGVRGHLLWDAGKAEIEDIDAGWNGGRVTGDLSIALRGNRPVYHLRASASNIEWKSGEVDAGAVLESSGIGDEVLERLHSTGTFTARGVDIDALPDLESAAGTFDLAWAQPAPVVRFPELQVVCGKDTFTGHGATQTDGRLLILLSSGSKEMHMTGSLAELRLETPETSLPSR